MQAIVPVIVPKADLALATTLDTFAWSITGAVGACVGGYATSWLGTTACFWLDAITYLVAGMFASQLRLAAPGGCITVGGSDRVDAGVARCATYMCACFAGLKARVVLRLTTRVHVWCLHVHDTGVCPMVSHTLTIATHPSTPSNESDGKAGQSPVRTPARKPSKPMEPQGGCSGQTMVVINW